MFSAETSLKREEKEGTKKYITKLKMAKPAPKNTILAFLFKLAKNKINAPTIVAANGALEAKMAKNTKETNAPRR